MRLLLFYLGALMLAVASVAQEFAATERGVTIRTERFEIVWQDGAMQQVTTLLPERSLLTLAEGGMTNGDLPVGPGSFHGQAKGECTQVNVVWSHRLSQGPPSYPAQFAPGAESVLTVETIPGGRRLTYVGLGKDASAVLIQELTIAETTGDLVVRQRARSENPGLFGISLGLLNLRPDLEFAIPYFGGQRFGGSLPGNGVVGYSWPQFWNAGLIVGEIPGGGSFFVMSDDAGLRPKYFKLYHTDERQGLSVQHSPDGPYDELKEIEVAPWRFNTFAGSWVEPAMRYRGWLAEAYALKPIAERSVAWYDEMAMVWSGGLSVPKLKRLAERFDPRHTLVVDLGWSEGFNRRAPHYRPRGDGYAESVAAAQEMGYRVGVYTSMKLIDQQEHLSVMRELGLQYWYDAMRGNAPALPDADVDPSTLPYLAHIHPGNEGWIEYYSDVMVGLRKEYGVDLLYQDVSGGQPGSGGVVDGRNVHEGTVACDLAIRRKLPEVALGGEFWSEVNVAAGEEMGLQNPMSWFGEDHKVRMARYPHAIQSAIFAPFSTYMSYNTPMRSGAHFHYDQNVIEAIGGMATWKGAEDDSGGEAEIVLARARLFAEGFRPYFPLEWEEDVAGYLRHPDGRVVRYRHDNLSSFCYLDDELVYARITGMDRWKAPTPMHIDGWVAYNSDGPVGLDPDEWYCLLPGAPVARRVVIRDVWEGARITGIRENDIYTLVTFEAPEGELQGSLETEGRGQAVHEAAAGNYLLAADKEGLPVEVDNKLMVADWDRWIIGRGRVLRAADWLFPPKRWTLGGTTLMSYSVHPEMGGPGAEVSLDGYLQLPVAPDLALQFHMGRLGGAGDGVHFVVRVNGREIWRQFSPGGQAGWEKVTIPLAAYSGETVVLSLAVDCGRGGFNLSNDASLWGEPMLVMQAAHPDAAPTLD